MKRVTLSNACPPMPEAFHHHIIRTIDPLEERKLPKGRRLSAVLAAVLIGVLLLMGLAYAATQSGLLGSLFGNRAPSEAAQALLQAGERAEHNGVTLAVDEYLLDGNLLHVTCTFLSNVEEPLVCGIAFPTLNGAAVHSGSFSLGVGMDTLLDLKKGVPVTLYMSASLGGGIDTQAPVEIGVTGYAMKPVADLKALSAGVKVTDGTEGQYDLWSEEVTNLLDGSQSIADAYETLGYTKTVAELPVKITVQPEMLKAVKHTAVYGQDTFDFPEYTLKIIRADFGAASTVVEIHMYPKRPFGGSKDDGGSDDPLLNRSFMLLGPNGEDLTKGQIGGGWDSGIMGEGEENGEPEHYCWLGEWGPIEAPDQVVLMPCDFDSEEYIEAEAVTVTLVK